MNMRAVFSLRAQIAIHDKGTELLLVCMQKEGRVVATVEQHMCLVEHHLPPKHTPQSDVINLMSLCVMASTILFLAMHSRTHWAKSHLHCSIPEGLRLPQITLTSVCGLGALPRGLQL